MEMLLREPTPAEQDEYGCAKYPLLKIATLGSQPLNANGEQGEYADNDGGDLTVLVYPDCLVFSYAIGSPIPWDPDSRDFILECNNQESTQYAEGMAASIDLPNATTELFKQKGFTYELR